MVNSLTQFQNQFGRNMIWSIAIILMFISLISFSTQAWIAGVLFGGLGILIAWFIKKYPNN
ncbi:MAG: hypothetical protein IIA87_03685 [Nanoarchaeota archaeon]|nr:hypothetical protein [Nanoarchaeota archaeon]